MVRLRGSAGVARTVEVDRPRGEIRALTGLRFVAALWVVLYHFRALLMPLLGPVAFLKPVLAAGWLGVELFFVLSGFVITLSYVEECGRRFSVPVAARFLVARFARVWPAWAVMTVLSFTALLLIRGMGWDPDAVIPHPPLTEMPLLRQLTMTQMWGRESLKGSSFDAPGWSISAEWLAYVAFPLLALVLRPLRRLPATVLLVLAVGAMLPLVVDEYVHGLTVDEIPWFARLSWSFVAGALAALAVRRSRRGPWSDRLGLVMVVVSTVSLLVVCSWAAWRSELDGRVYYGVAVGVFPLLVAGLALTGRGPSRWLSGSVLCYGGRISYCLYLVHFPLRDQLLAVVWRDPADFGRMTPGLALGAPGLVALSLAAAVALHHGVEVPGRRAILRLGQRVPLLRRPAPPAPAPAPAEPVIGAVGLFGQTGSATVPVPRVPGRGAPDRAREIVGPSA
jgi:peptidoglycan/LPS O-acetylase OafA/YrhL